LKQRQTSTPVGLNAKIETRIDGLLKRMTVEEKVGQIIQPKWSGGRNGLIPGDRGLLGGRTGKAHEEIQIQGEN
jgi:hypothetical protein